MAKIIRVKVWKNPTKTECRIYAKAADDGREGCHYITGNNWNEKGSYDGDLTNEEWQRARELSIWNNTWHTVYENEMDDRIAQVERGK